jgi:phage gpG-like protein
LRSEIVKSDFRALNDFVKGITSKANVKVGIFGKKSGRKEGSLTNAEVGAIHEFGSFSRGIPARSFLRMPLFQKSETIVSEGSAGSLKMLAKGNLIGILKNLGIACERAILGAFDSRGYGTWAPLKVRKGTPLIDTGQLRRAITSKVERK